MRGLLGARGNLAGRYRYQLFVSLQGASYFHTASSLVHTSIFHACLEAGFNYLGREQASSIIRVMNQLAILPLTCAILLRLLDPSLPSDDLIDLAYRDPDTGGSLHLGHFGHGTLSLPVRLRQIHNPCERDAAVPYQAYLQQSVTTHTHSRC